MTGASWFMADHQSRFPVASWFPSQSNLRRFVARTSDSSSFDFLEQSGNQFSCQQVQEHYSLPAAINANFLNLIFPNKELF